MSTYYEFIADCFENNLGLRVIKEYDNYCRRNQGKKIFISKFIEQLEDSQIKKLSRNAIVQYVNAYKNNKVEEKIADIDFLTLLLFTYPSSITNKYKEWKTKEFLEFANNYEIKYGNEHLGLEDFNITYVQNIVSKFNSKYYYIDEYERSRNNKVNTICGLPPESAVFFWRIDKKNNSGINNIYRNYMLSGLDVAGVETFKLNMELRVPGLNLNDDNILICDKKVLQKAFDEIVEFNSNQEEEYYNIFVPSPISVRLIDRLKSETSIKCKLYSDKIKTEVSDRNQRREINRIKRFIQL